MALSSEDDQNEKDKNHRLERMGQVKANLSQIQQD